MKKITFILFALITGTTFAQIESAESATASANAAAEIVSPITISAQQDLNFGKVANNTAGTVVVATDGTLGGTNLSQIGSTAPAAASFEVTAANSFNYTIALPTSVNLKSGVETITVDSFNHNATTTTGNAAAQTIGVGATLTVAAQQATGNYTGTFDVTVSYD